jgi:hypothetical protein
MDSDQFAQQMGKFIKIYEKQSDHDLLVNIASLLALQISQTFGHNNAVMEHMQALGDMIAVSFRYEGVKVNGTVQVENSNDIPLRVTQR